MAQAAPTPLTILLAAQAPVLVARMANAVFFLKANPAVSPSLSAFDRALVRPLLIRGLQFSLAGPLNNFLTLVFPILVIGAVGPASHAAAFAAVMNAVIILSSVFGISARPLMGALPEAHARGAAPWIARSYRRTLRFNVGYGVLVFLLFAIAGPRLFEFWYQGTVAPTAALLSLAGAYLICLGIDVTNFTFLSARGEVATVSAFLSVKSITFAILLIASLHLGIDYMPFALLIGTSLLLSAGPLTYLALRRLRHPS